MFSIDQLLNIIRGQIAGSFNSIAHVKTATVDAFIPDQNGYKVRVVLQPEMTKTDFLPILTPWVGENWGFYAPPSKGDTVIVLFLEGNNSSGIVLPALNTKKRPLMNPAPKQGELWMVHKTGTYLKFLDDGTVEIKTLDKNNVQTKLKIDADIEVTGNMTVTGDILDNSGSNTNNIRQFRDKYDNHIQPTPSGDTGKPYPEWQV